LPNPCPFDEALLLLPEGGVDGVGVARVDEHLIGARVFVLVEDFLERAPAVGRAKDAALGVGAVGVTEDGHEEAVLVARVDADGGDHLAFAQPQMRPRLAGVGRLVHPVADGQVGADDPRTASDIDRIGIGRCDGDGADRAGGLVVEDRDPVGAVVGRPPHAAVVEAGVEGVGERGDARDRARASGAGGADLAPAHLRE
jgi:hypothetical protein